MRWTSCPTRCRPRHEAPAGDDRRGLVKLGVAAKLTGVLDAADVPYEVFDQVPPDSSMDVVNEVARLYAERGCDGFVAIGGGSVIDTTKGAGRVAGLRGRGLRHAARLGDSEGRPAAVHRRAHDGRHRQRGDAGRRGGRHAQACEAVVHLVQAGAARGHPRPRAHLVAAAEADGHHRHGRAHPRRRGAHVHPEEPRVRRVRREGGRADRGEPAHGLPQRRRHRSAHQPGAGFAYGGRGVLERHGGHRARHRPLAGRPLPHPARPGHDDAAPPLRAVQPGSRHPRRTLRPAAGRPRARSRRGLGRPARRRKRSIARSSTS